MGIDLSVIIPTYNRAPLLRACLAALAAQTQPAADFEVVVVVDGSTDATLPMLQQLQRELPYRLVVDVQPNGGAARARNRGAELASGRFGLFVDDDVLAEPNLVAEHLRAQRRAARPLVGLGHITYRLPARADGFACQVARWWQAHYARLEQGQAPGPLDCWSGNLSLPLADFRAVGGFDPGAEQSHDVDLGYRLHQHGLQLVYLPRATGHQQQTKGFSEIALDAQRAGAANVRLWRRHPPLLGSLGLGRFSEARLRFVLARRALLMLNPSVGALRLASRLLGRGRLAGAWYGLVFDYCYWRGVRGSVDRPTWRRLIHAPPILMYHAFGRPGEPASRFVVPVKRFARQMRLLRLLGYRVLSLDQLEQTRRQHHLPPPRSVVVTIDDGYADALELAWPVLRRYGVPATLFVVSGALDGPGTNTWDGHGALAGRRLLGWSALRCLAEQAGIGIGAHTRTHVRLVGLGADELSSQVQGARADLEGALGRPVTAFAYPYGAADAAARAAVRQAGFLAGCGIEPGGNSPGQPDLELRRTEIRGTDSLLRFALAVWLGDSLRDRRANGRRRGG